ncbi:MAG: hypothetical protein JST54_24085 [Deltaproteobacteria bacterium]|nr:hypothetical protein [Deltaproteobacteria bacterium]
MSRPQKTTPSNVSTSQPAPQKNVVASPSLARVEASAVAAVVTATVPTVDGELVFGADGNEQRRGTLVAGGKVSVAYDLERFPNLVTRIVDGAPTWGVKVCVMTLPSGEIQERELVDFESSGKARGAARVVPQTFEVPVGTQAVEVWFRNWAGAGEDHVAWDSRFGYNYRFDVAQR